MAKDFAEMVGVLQMRPKLDRRLLTIPSAKEVFGRNANKYEFSYEDMDNDPNTPATLLITKKAEMDEKGNVIPERLIAAGGYRIPFATAKQTEALMKDQHYYMKNPTSKQRKETKRDAFLYEKSKFADVYNKARPVRNTGLKLVVNFIKAAFYTGNFKFMPFVVWAIGLFAVIDVLWLRPEKGWKDKIASLFSVFKIIGFVMLCMNIVDIYFGVHFSRQHTT